MKMSLAFSTSHLVNKNGISELYVFVGCGLWVVEFFLLYVLLGKIDKFPWPVLLASKKSGDDFVEIGYCGFSTHFYIYLICVCVKEEKRGREKREGGREREKGGIMGGKNLCLFFYISCLIFLF